MGLKLFTSPALWWHSTIGVSTKTTPIVSLTHQAGEDPGHVILNAHISTLHLTSPYAKGDHQLTLLLL